MPLLLEQRQRTDSIRDWRRIHIPIGVGERPQGNSGPLYGANSNLMAQVPGFIPPCRAVGGSLCPGRPQNRLCRAPGDAGGQGAVLYQLAVQAPRVLTHGLLLQRVWEAERMG